MARNHLNRNADDYFRDIESRIKNSCFGKDSSPPPAPDYGSAAAAQGLANKEAALASSRLNNPNVVNPNGTQTWTEGATPEARPTVTQALSPEQQNLYNQSMQTKGLLGGLGIQGATALQGVVGKNLDMSGLPAAPTVQRSRDDVYNAMMARVNTDTAGARDQKNSELIAAGIRPGNKAYDAAMAGIDRGYNDARQQALIAQGAEGQRDFGMQTQARKDALGEMLAQRQTPLNEINALMSQSQVTNPFAVPGIAQNTNIAPAPLFGAAQAQYGAQSNAYNAQQAGNQSAMNGLFSLGAAAAGAPGFLSGLGKA